MKKYLYSILDTCSGYGMPIVQDNDAVAMRNFENACSDKSSVYSTHCSDFSLWRVGSYDTDTGELESGPQEKICSAFDFVSRISNDN